MARHRGIAFARHYLEGQKKHKRVEKIFKKPLAFLKNVCYISGVDSVVLLFCCFTTVLLQS